MGMLKGSVGVSKGVIAKRNGEPPANHDVVIDDFHIVELIQIGSSVVAIVRYLNCANHGGLKVMVYRNTDHAVLRHAKCLDPHFLETGLSPFARFEPTFDGIAAASATAKLLNTLRKE
jgi:hypothetical protein